jgi:subtilisin family serine protease
MRRVITTFTLAILFAAPGWAAMTVSDELQGVLAYASDEELVPVYVVMHEQAGYEYFRPMIQGMSKTERRAFVIDELKQMASRTQAPLISYLKTAELAGDVRDVRSLWLVNLVSFEAKPSVIDNVADMFEARYMWYNNVVPAEEAMDAGVSGSTTGGSFTDTPNQGVAFVNAPAAWAAGFYGEGIVVGNVDSGSEWYHSDLAEHIWVNTAEDYNGNGYFEPYSSGSGGDEDGIDNDANGYIDDVIGWNFSTDSNDPDDSGYHGTATAGIVVGDGTNNSGDTTGVAPGAKLIILNINSATDAEWYEAYQYAAENGADVTTSSYSQKWPSHQPDYSAFRFANENELALGVLHTNSIGNQGDQLGTYPIPYNVSAPGNSPPPWLHPDQTLVGGIASVLGCGALQASSVRESYSGLGPSAWEDIHYAHPSYPHNTDPLHRDYPYEAPPFGMGLIKPDICGPGSFTYSTSSGGGYTSFGGTSSATPHVGGCAALTLSANPGLMPEQLAEVLMTTAVELGPPGKDTAYGAGRVDAYAACTMAVNMPTSIGWVEGTVDDGTNPIQGATVTMRSGNSRTTDPTGYYICYGDTIAQYIVCEAFGFDTDSALVTPLVGDTITQNFTLAAGANGSLSGTVSGQGSGPIAGAVVTILGAPIAPDTTDGSGDYSFPTVPPGTYDVTASASGWMPDTAQVTINSGQNTVQDFMLDGFPPVLIWEPDPTPITAAAITPHFNSAGFNVYTSSSFADIQPLLSAGANQVLFVCVGIYSNNHVIPSGSAEATAIESYIASSGKVYLEGGDVWYYDPLYQGGHDFGPSFRITTSNDGDDITGVTGVGGTFTGGMSFSYPNASGETGWHDVLGATGGSFNVFNMSGADPGPGMIAYDGGASGKTIGCSFEIGSLTDGSPTTLSELVDSLISFFELVVDVPDEGGLAGLPSEFALHAAYPNPFNPTTTIAFDLPSTSTVRLDVYNVLGQRVATLVDGELPAGVHEIRWDASSVGSGVYFARITTGENTATTKMVLLK